MWGGRGGLGGSRRQTAARSLQLRFCGSLGSIERSAIRRGEIGTGRTALAVGGQAAQFPRNMNHRHLLPGLALIASLVATMSSAVTPTPEQVSAKAGALVAAETARANEFFDRVFDEAVARSPEFMTQLGMKKDYDKWDDLSEQHALEDFVLNAKNYEELKRTINFDRLDDQGKVSYQMVVNRGEPFDKSGKKSPLLEDIEGKVGALKDTDAATKQKLLADARAALTGAVQPAYEKLIAVMEAQQKIATDDDGAWKFAEGLDFYAFALRGSTTTRMTADEIHQLGLREVARIHHDMEAIMKQVGFKGDLPAFLKYIKEDPQFYYPTTPEGKAAYLKRATQIIDDMRARLDELLIT